MEVLVAASSAVKLPLWLGKQHPATVFQAPLVPTLAATPECARHHVEAMLVLALTVSKAGPGTVSRRRLCLQVLPNAPCKNVKAMLVPAFAATPSPWPASLTPVVRSALYQARKNLW